jgi:AcrR family transcriptional regulator
MTEGNSRPSGRRYAKGEQTREQILGAAKRLFAQRGYFHTSIEDLLGGSERTKGAVFHHWRTKEELALELLGEMERNYEQKAFQLLHSDAPARAVLERVMETLASANGEPEWYCCRMLAIWSAEFGPADAPLGARVHALQERWMGFWRELLTRAQAAGDLASGADPRTCATMLAGAILGFQLLSRNGLSSVDSGGFYRALLRSILR